MSIHCLREVAKVARIPLEPMMAAINSVVKGLDLYNDVIVDVKDCIIVKVPRHVLELSMGKLSIHQRARLEKYLAAGGGDGVKSRLEDLIMIQTMFRSKAAKGIKEYSEKVA